MKNPALPRVLRALRARDFRLLWMGQTVSLVGDGVASVAITWQALTLSPNPMSLALVLFARAVPRSALLLVAGAVTDRGRKRAAIIAADIAQALMFAMLALLAASDWLNLWHLVALSATQGAASAFALPATTALIRETVDESLIESANATYSTSRMFAETFAGPAIGGMIIATTGTALAFGIDALTFAISATLLAFVRTVERAPSSSALLTEVRDGIAYALREPWLAVSLITFALVNFVATAPMSVLLPILVRNNLHAGAGTLGLAVAAFGLGGAAGGIVSGQLRRPRRPLVAAYYAFGVGSILIGTLGIVRTWAVIPVIMFAVGACFEWGNVVWASLIQRRVPPSLLGRVASIDWLLSLGLFPIAVGLAGPVALATSIPLVMALGGLAGAGIAAAGGFVVHRDTP